MKMTTPSSPTAAASPPPPRRRRRRWILRGLGALLLLLGLVVAVLPQLLGTSWARPRLLAQINRGLAPDGSLAVARFRFSWTGPTRLTGFELRNDQGRPVASTAEAVLDRSLWQLLADRPRYGTLDLGAARLQIEERPDGSIDLLEALGPLQNPNPSSELKLRVRDGSLHLVSATLGRPLAASRLNLFYEKPQAPHPRSIEVTLGQPPAGATATPPALLIRASEDRWAVTTADAPDCELLVIGHHWPVDLARPEGQLVAQFDGTIRARRANGLWATTGQSNLAELRLTAPWLIDTPVHLPTLEAQWDLAHGGALAVVVRHLALTTPVGALRAEPTESAADLTQIEGQFDLAALAAFSPGTGEPGRPTIDHGHARFRLTAGRGEPPAPDDIAIAATPMEPLPALDLAAFAPPAPQPALSAEAAADTSITTSEYYLDLQAVLPDLWLSTAQGRRTRVPPLDLALRARQPKRAGPSEPLRIELERLDARLPQGSLASHGSIDDPAGQRRIDWKGQFDLDWELLADRMSTAIDQASWFEAGPIDFHVTGDLGPSTALDASLLDRLHWSLATQMIGADVLGMQFGPARLAGQVEPGRITIDPIRSTLNGGVMELHPAIVRLPDGSWLASLGSRSTIRDAAINPEVSDRVLAYVVPVMTDTTQVTGRLSADVGRAQFPLAPDFRPLPGSVVEGQLIFNDVRFTPGPLATTLVGLVAPAVRTDLALEQAVVLDIRDGRVFQHGLSLAIGRLARITVDGSVGFDQSLDLVVSVPLQAERFQNVPVFNRVSSALRADIPIRGTLDQPRVDTDAFGRAMGRMGIDVANEATGGGVGAILDLINAVQQPLTPEEEARRQAVQEARRAEQQRRRQERQQRAEERRQERQNRRAGP